MAFTNSSPYSSAKPIGDTKLAESLPDGFGIKGLEWMPTGAGRALYGCGLTLMIVFGWLAYATYSRPNVVWDEVASVQLPNIAASDARKVDRSVDIPVAAPGRYVIVVSDDETIADRARHEVTADWDRYESSRPNEGPSIEAAPDDAHPMAVQAHGDFRSQRGTMLTIYARPLTDPPTKVHLPTFRRDLILVAIGFVMFVVGMALRHRYVKALKRRAAEIERGLAAASAAAG